jgi:hypothetical protein
MKKFYYKILLFLLIPIILNHCIVWFYEQPQRTSLETGNSIKHQKWQAIKKNTNQFDVIILGSSRGYSSYNPYILDSLTTLNTFNMCTGSQHVIESLYMLKEILKHQKPKYLIFDVFLPSFRENPDLFHVFSNAKYMSNEIILNEFKSYKILDYFFPIVKYKTYLKDDLKRMNSIGDPFIENYKNWYKGYKPSKMTNDSISIKSFSSLSNFSNINVIPKKEIEKYILEIQKLCKLNDVKLICVRTPFPPTRLYISKVDKTHHYFKTLFSQKNIEFIDLNYVSTEKYTDYDFLDSHHLNSIGAKKVSTTLSRIINESESLKTKNGQ